MRHADPDQLALMALGEPADDRELTAHLDRCPECRAEVESLRRTVDLARETVADRGAVRPPEPVWHRIAADLALHTDPRTAASDTDRPAGVPGTDPRTAGAPPGGWSAAEAGPDGSGGGVGPVPVDLAAERGRRRRRIAVGIAALVAAAAVGVVGTLVAVRPWSDGSPAAVTTASASLAPVTGGPGGVSGRVAVVQDGSGPELEVDTTGLPAAGGYYEVWVFDGGSDMVSVGVLGGDTRATLRLPSTLDLRRFRIVDISEEQYDGDQTHSTVSVLRGTLTS